MDLKPNLIYDIGMHKGEDTAYYLAKGFDVIAFEADPNLINYCKDKFASEITSGRLKIVEGAIVNPEANIGDSITFYQSVHNSVWGTIDPEWAKRNESFGDENIEIEIPTIILETVIKKYGVPYYMKIDIEGADIFCLHALYNLEEKPCFLSIESEKVNFHKLVAEMVFLQKLGYDNFQVINQADIAKLTENSNNTEGKYLGYNFEFGSSGPFGNDLPSGKWMNIEETIHSYKSIFKLYNKFGDQNKSANRFPLRYLRSIIESIKKETVPGWHDTHAMHSSFSKNNEPV